ncbi:precorrin-2 C(20)-methyltransferase [Anaerosalibacter sp. Marseille-P3206]|uniref:precorrin-2 C(20)-methyltransferase n=1 Tax=Anaerosalibacter sp. Marseille-P3206 TaxID=1871005 RepID=UPI001F3C16FC|nr:precorrin-2 C(20)-methyltransferase [Anaerosalibacter sp. Marseille-P3206]
MMKKLYGVGTGPGDVEHLTLKAVRVINEADVIFAPNNKGKKMALDTVKPFILDKKVVFVDFPMGQVKGKDYSSAAKTIEEEILENGCGVFLTIGDPMVYSTFIYLMEEIEKIGVEVEIVPGITSFTAGAAVCKTALTEKGDRFLLCDEMVDEDILKCCDSICVLKTSKNKEDILNILEKNKFSYSYIKRCTLPEELVLVDREEILADKDYMSFIIGRRLKND